jgi:thiosulfate dehydrogenase [quinone] large subunit
MVHKDARYLAAAVQGLIGWEWLVSGANKVLSGNFPSGLAGSLRDAIKGNPNGWYAAFLKTVILPHSVFVGYAIEIVEVLTGLALLSGMLLFIGGIRRHGDPQYHLALAQVIAASIAAFACGVLCVNFHFLMGDGVLPGLSASQPFNEGVSLDTLMPPMALVILFFNLYALSAMTGVPLKQFPQRIRMWLRAPFSRTRHTLPATAEGAI